MSWESKNLRCYNCKFWWPSAEAAGSEPSRKHSILGQCRRHAPPPLIGDQPEQTRHYPAWSVVKRDDWCGEHLHQEIM